MRSTFYERLLCFTVLYHTPQERVNCKESVNWQEKCDNYGRLKRGYLPWKIIWGCGSINVLFYIERSTNSLPIIWRALVTPCCFVLLATHNLCVLAMRHSHTTSFPFFSRGSSFWLPFLSPRICILRWPNPRDQNRNELFSISKVHPMHSKLRINFCRVTSLVFFILALVRTSKLITNSLTTIDWSVVVIVCCRNCTKEETLSLIGMAFCWWVMKLMLLRT